MDIDMGLYNIKKLDGLDNNYALECAGKLADRYFGEKSVVEFGSAGTCGLVYYATYNGKKIAIKIFRTPGMHRTQAFETELLAKYCTAHIPETLFVHDATADINVNAIGMEFCEGDMLVHINPNDWSVEEKRRLAETFCEGLHSIHTGKNDKYGFVENPVYDSWFDYYKPYAKGLCDWVSANGRNPVHKMGEEFTYIIEKTYDMFDEIFFEPICPPTLCHGDLCVCNVLVNPDTLELTAIIDPWKSMWADVDYDLHNIDNITGCDYRLLDTYKKKYAVSETCDLKCAFYALYNEVYCYIQSGLSYEYIYPKMIGNLKRHIKYYLGKEI